MMNRFLKYRFIETVFVSILLLSGCASRQMIFKDASPVRYFNDIQPIPVPKTVHYNILDYYANVLPPRPTVKIFNVSKNKSATDINSLDEVPASSWYMPRLGFENLTANQIIEGPTEIGPPVPPITIHKIRQSGNNPRFIVSDSRNILYLLKFDPPEFPGIATSSSFIVNRIFWAFGYHVPENHLFQFRFSDLKPSPNSDITFEQIRARLAEIADPIDGTYRAISSRIIEGFPLGPAPEKGVRQEDPNDFFPHEERRVLRGLRAFCALTNMSDINSDNIFDIYVGNPGKGYIKHYLIDFDDAFGTNAARKNILWSGYNQNFSFRDILENLFTLGLRVEDWEKITPTQWKSVGLFESSVFKPEDWKETHPFKPIRDSQPADNYWAAKIIVALTPEHIRALVNAAGYTEKGAAEYIANTLMERRNKILTHFLKQVSPIEFEKFEGRKIIFRNIAKAYLNEPSTNARYKIQFSDNHGIEIRDALIRYENSALVSFPLSDSLLSKTNGYLKIAILPESKNYEQLKAAEFHFRVSDNLQLRLVGVVH